MTSRPPIINTPDAGSGVETPAAVKVPLPDEVNPVGTTKPEPETDPDAPTN
jgi:hypothetical protein